MPDLNEIELWPNELWCPRCWIMFERCPCPDWKTHIAAREILNNPSLMAEFMAVTKYIPVESRVYGLERASSIANRWHNEQRARRERDGRLEHQA